MEWEHVDETRRESQGTSPGIRHEFDLLINAYRNSIAAIIAQALGLPQHHRHSTSRVPRAGLLTQRLVLPRIFMR